MCQHGEPATLTLHPGLQAKMCAGQPLFFCLWAFRPHRDAASQPPYSVFPAVREFISKSLDKWAYEHGVTMDFPRPGKPTVNPFIGSFNSSLRDEYLNIHWFLSLEGTQEKPDNWREQLRAAVRMKSDHCKTV